MAHHLNNHRHKSQLTPVTLSQQIDDIMKTLEVHHLKVATGDSGTRSDVFTAVAGGHGSRLSSSHDRIGRTLMPVAVGLTERDAVRCDKTSQEWMKVPPRGWRWREPLIVNHSEESRASNYRRESDSLEMRCTGTSDPKRYADNAGRWGAIPSYQNQVRYNFGTQGERRPRGHSASAKRHGNGIQSEELLDHLQPTRSEETYQLREDRPRESSSWTARSPTQAREKQFKKVPSYDGSSSLHDYLIQFEMISELNQWSSEMKALQLATSLQGKARGVLCDIEPHQ